MATLHGVGAACALVDALARTVLIAPTGARGVATLAEGVVAHAEALTDDPRDRALADALAGATVRGDGSVGEGSDPPVWCVDFVSAP